MKVCNILSPESYCCDIKSTTTLGNFDGVHIGHRHIIKKVISSARKNGEQSAVVTFDRHPAYVLNPEHAPKLLTTLDEKMVLIESLGIDTVYIITFTRQVSEMGSEEFIRRYLINCLGMSHFIVGYDHGFGRKREGSPKNIQNLADRHHFTLEIQTPVTYDGSKIRTQILEGDVHGAAAFLGRDYSFPGIVISGYGLGKRIGIPTANIKSKNDEKIIPCSGVYAGWIEFDNHKRDAVISLGPQPTFNRNEEVTEVHIPGFSDDLYQKEVTVGFTRRLRNIEKFDSEQELVQQIRKDIEHLKQFITLQIS